MEFHRVSLSTLLALAVLATASSATADVSIGEWVIQKGNTIEIVGPDDSFDLQQIIDDIQDEGAANRYLIKLGPGLYELDDSESLTLVPYVDLSGSGQGTSEILGDVAASGGGCVVFGASDSVLSDLTVSNESISTSNSYGVCSVGSSPTIQRVTARATGDPSSGRRVGFYASGGGPVLIDVTGSADGGANAYGIYCTGSSPTVSRAWLTGKNGNSTSRGAWMVGTCAMEVRDVEISAEGAPQNYGIFMQVNTVLDLARATIAVPGTGVNRGLYFALGGEATLNDVSVRPSGGSSNTGIDIPGPGVLRLFRTTVSGSTASIRSDSAVEAFVSQSTLFGDVTGTGTVTCVASDDGGGSALDSTCAVIP